MESVLILGSSGLVGRALCQRLKEKYKIYGTYNNRDFNIDGVTKIKFDLDNYQDISQILDNYKPDKIINCLNGDFKKQLNVVKELVNYSKQHNAYIYFVSTWNVFDEYPYKTYCEDDSRKSDTDYGNYKINAENELLDNIKDRCMIFRLPMMFGKDSPRFNTLKLKLEQGEPIEVITNMSLNHNTDVFLAKQIDYLIENYSFGIFHVCSLDSINHCKFIKELVYKLGYKNAKFKEIQDGDENIDYICALSSNQIFPKELNITNDDIIDYLVE